MNRALTSKRTGPRAGWASAKMVYAILIGAFLFVLGPAVFSAHAASPGSALPQLIQPPLETGAPTQPIDVVVVLDDSGSMATCWPWPQGSPPFGPPCGGASPNPPSDPEELRYSAARLLLQLADDDDRLAVVRFDTIAEGVGSLGSLQRLGDGANRQALAATLQPPTDYTPRGYTRIDLGLDLANTLLQQGREPGRNQYVLLLTDGEPTAPAGSGQQRPRIAETLGTLRNDGVLVFPVVLCNETAGCPAEFLREQFADFGVKEAGTAPDLLHVFSEIFTLMKPDRSLIANSSAGSALEFTTRAPHGVQSVALVTPRGGLTALQRDDAPMLTSNVLNDPNIEVNVLESGSLAEGRWAAQTTDPSSFAVIQAAGYPELINPPPSLGNSQASVRYYPAGKPPLLIARAVGPGSGETLLYNGDVEMDIFGQDNTRALLLNEEPGVVRLQLGTDTQPLQLERSFRLEARAGLPTAEVFLPLPTNPGLLEDGRARLQAGFGPGATVANMAATVYVFEEGAGDERPLVYQANMICEGGACRDENFKPVDGRAYQIYYVVQGEVDNVRFSDWADAMLELAPAVYMRGLPAQLDLAQMPEEGWPVELGSGTQEEIGSLAASIVLRNRETGEVAEGVTLDFVEDVPEEGTVQSALRVVGLDTLRPGAYEGEITLQATNPAGRPMDVNIRPGGTLPVTLTVDRPLARIDAQAVDFGDVLFDTSPNFRLNQSVMLPVAFAGRPFKIGVTSRDPSCSNVNIVTGDLTEQDGRPVLPLHLTSTGPVQPGACTGTLAFSGPNGDYDVVPAEVAWQSRVASVEWSIVGGDLHLDDLQDAGGRAQETLLVRFNGKTPFVVELAGLQGLGSSGDETEAAPIALDGEFLDVPAVEVSGPANESGLYEVPITLIARQRIPGDELRGTFYSGQLQLAIAGLQDDVKTVNFNFRSPSLYQRYLAPVVAPVYSMPWVLCTGPLTLLVLLVVVARIRGRGFDDNELEEAAVAATREVAAANAAVPEPATALPSAATAMRREVAWGSSEWGSVWNNPGGDAGSSARSANSAANKPSGDPWSSSW